MSEFENGGTVECELKHVISDKSMMEPTQLGCNAYENILFERQCSTKITLCN